MIGFMIGTVIGGAIGFFTAAVLSQTDDDFDAMEWERNQLENSRTFTWWQE